MRPTTVITGAGGGIGRATAELFEERGWDVIGIDRHWPDGMPKGSLEFDLADDGALREVLGGLPRLEALVNLAGVMKEAPLSALVAADIDHILRSNVTAAIVATGAAIPALAAAAGGRGGSVVNIASVHAVASRANLAAYAASKGALISFTRQAAIELGPQGIRVNAVLPGAVDTPMLAGEDAAARPEAIAELAAKTPLRRIAAPREIAEVIAFLADGERSSFVTGAALAADGGALARLGTE